ncbi:MAG TPA: metalloregulator ArsR/SmtB family transcription factor [Kofleriaceae bacterium]|nr:metalloregulator ArsR/SmtB family transcription factor [Kofleriaceae bacterium]
MKAAELDRTLIALADPTRRGVIDLLRRAPHRASDIADRLGTSRPAMSRHLRVLRHGGLVETFEDDDARVRVYRLRPEKLRSLRAWLEEVEQFWTVELGAFQDHVERTRGKR